MTRARRLWFAALAVAGCHGDDGGGAKDATVATPDGRDAGGIDVGFIESAALCSSSSPSPCPPLAYATWRMPSPPGVQSSAAAAYVVTDKTAKESVSGLTWQRTSTEKKTWADGQSYCRDMVLGGFDDWRLPSRIELISLVDFTRLPSIDHEAFPETPNDYFWSASPTSSGDFYFSVYFGAGLTAFAVPTSASAHVRCVRGGGPGVIPRYEVTDATVVDRNTQLTWQRSALDQPLPWESAAEYCKGLKNGWRLPSTKELQTIVDETRQGPAADPAVFPNVALASYWTSTPVNKSGLMSAVYLDMRDGTTEEAQVTEAFWVRCVR